jgi:hypothetical protein
MTTSIQIEIFGTDLETIAIALDQKEVKALYENSKELKEQIKNLEKEVDSQKSTSKYYQDLSNKRSEEINQANMLLTALGVQLQTNEEEYYRRNDLPIATRIALYIATNK